MVVATLSCSTDSGSSEGKNQPPPPLAASGATTPASAGAPAQKSPAPKSAPTSSLPRIEGEHHPVFSLADNRMQAHLIRQDGLLIAGGDPGIAKYLSFGRPWKTWKINKKIDDKRVAIAHKGVSWLTVPLTAEQAQGKVLAMRLKSPKAQGVRIKINGKKLKAKKFEKGWHQAQWEIPPGVLTTGENKLEIHWGARGTLGNVKRAYAALDWLFLGAQDPPEELSTQIKSDQGLELSLGDGLAYYIHPYPGAKLKLRFAAQTAAARCGVKVKISPREGQPTVVTRTETALEEGQVETFIDLASIADQTARMEITAEGEHCKRLALTEAAIVMPGPAPKVKRGAAPKNVLFWMIDNARSDRFKLYNPETRVETPVITKLGETGTVFENSFIVGTESRVSHAALWTGMFPRQTRFVGPKKKLPSGYVTLPEAIKKAGLKTICWVANGNISRFWGFAEGWNFFRNTLHKGGGLTAKRLADHAIDHITEKGDTPFYLYVGTIDPHVSWRGRQPWLKRYHPEPYNGIFQKNVMGPTWDKLAGAPQNVSARDRKRIQAIYDSTISYNDMHLGRVLEALEKKGIRDQTMIVITADHGEELWEYGRIGHGGSLRNTVVKVPLIIHYPPLFGKGVRVHEGADVIGIMSSILDALGQPIPSKVQAGSLLPLAHGIGRGYPRPAYATQYELAHTIQMEQFKLRVGGNGIPRIYDLSSKRKERGNLRTERPLITRWLTDALSTFLIYQSRWRQSRWGVFNNHLAALPEDLEQGTGPKPIRP